MTPKGKRIRIAALVVVVAAFLSLRTSYIVDSKRWAEALCNEHECDVFISQGKEGWAVRGYQFVGGLALNILGAAYSPTHERARTLVLRVTPESVEQYSFDEAVGPLEFYKGTIYVRVAGGREDCLCRWTGRGYEKLTEQERATLDQARRAGETWHFAKQGWTRNYLNLGIPVSVELDGVKMTFDVEGAILGNQFLSISGFGTKVPQTTWRVSERQHWVGREEFYRIFGPDPERYRVRRR